MSLFSTTGTLTLETPDEDDPFDWVGDSDTEEFPRSKETVHDFYEDKPFVASIAETNGGLVIRVPDAGEDRHEGFGGMVREHGWVVDYIDWADGMLQISPIPEEVLQQ